MQSRMLRKMGGLAVLAVCAGTAWAAPDEDTGTAAPARQAPAQPQADGHDLVHEIAAPAAWPVLAETAQAADTAGLGPAVDTHALARSRGGADTTNTTNNTNLSGVVTNNSAVNVVTGNNVIDAGSFANMSGIPVVIQNSGANVLIQNSTVVNLQMK